MAFAGEAGVVTAPIVYWSVHVYSYYEIYNPKQSLQTRPRTSFPAEIGHFDEGKNATVGAELRRIIESNGFRINVEKVRLYTNTHRQSVTGLTVNEKPNIPRHFIRQIRAIIHAWDKYGLEAASQEHEARYYRRRGKRGKVPTLDYIPIGEIGRHWPAVLYCNVELFNS